MATIILFLASALAPVGSADDSPFSHADLEKLPVGLKVVHSPNPALATLSGKSELRGKYTWWHKTVVSSIDSDVKVVEFGAFVRVDDQWVFSTFTQKPFTAKDFAEWYSCPDGLIKKGKEFTDPTNWGSGNELIAGKTKWYYIGIDEKGRRVKGEAVIETKAGIDPKRPKD